MQLAAKRHFVHGHPGGSTAWNTPERVEFMMRPEVDAVVLCMYAYGMKSEDEKGVSFVKNLVRMMSSSPEVLTRVEA